MVTFNVSANFLIASDSGGSAVLPDDTYTVTLLSGVGNNGFQDVSAKASTTAAAAMRICQHLHDHVSARQFGSFGHPRFRRGPNASGDTTTLVKVPNDPANGGHIGIPITIYNAANLTSAGFTLTYNANILTVTGGTSDPSNGGGDVPDDEQCLASRRHSFGRHLCLHDTPRR